MAKDEDEIVVPKKSKSTKASSSDSGTPSRASQPMRRIMRGTAAAGIALGGFVTLAGVMGVVGLGIENIWVRLVVGLLVVIGLPAFLADRLLKRSESTLATRGGLGMVADVFAIVLLGIALMLVGADTLTSSLFAHEADLHAKHGSLTMARAVYFVAGVSPVFPGDKPSAKPGGSSSSSAAPSSSSSPSSSASPAAPK